MSPEEVLTLLAPWLEGPFTLKEARERYGPLVEKALKARALKPVPTRFGEVLVPSGKGRRALGLTRFYTPRPSTLEDLIAVRREVERLQGQGYRLVAFERRRRPLALLEGNGEKVLVVAAVGEGKVGGRDLVRQVDRVVVLVPEPGWATGRGRQVEVRAVWT